MTSAIYVALGGMIGVLSRYFLTKQFTFQFGSFSLPIATFLSNIGSCILLGYIITKAHNGLITEDQKYFWTIGFCGGLSTFSTLIYELYEYKMHDQLTFGIAYVVISCLLGLLGIMLGIKLG